MNKIDIPVATGMTGPGSQPADEDGVELDYMQMPSDMTTYSMPVIPEPEEIKGLDEGIAMLKTLHRELSCYRAGDPARVLELDKLDNNNRTLVDQVLGNGEVSIVFNGNVHAQIQESVLAGVWRIQYVDEHGKVLRNVVEVAVIPGLVAEATFSTAAESVNFKESDLPDTVYNAAPLLTEINDKLPEFQLNPDPHIINLSLLPHTEEDLAFLAASLGEGSVVILSRGYGNCRISSTSTRNVWWVVYFNSQDTVILNTIEVSKIPNVACAAKEDIEDSTERLNEILKVYV